MQGSEHPSRRNRREWGNVIRKSSLGIFAYQVLDLVRAVDGAGYVRCSGSGRRVGAVYRWMWAAVVHPDIGRGNTQSKAWRKWKSMMTGLGLGESIDATPIDAAHFMMLVDESIYWAEGAISDAMSCALEHMRRTGAVAPILRPPTGVPGMSGRIPLPPRSGRTEYRVLGLGDRIM